jgi:nucleoside-diphosphate-sugar epimerase
MNNVALIACVTGGSGMIGKRIVDILLRSGYQVRVLSRQQQSFDSRVEVIGGDLRDEKTLAKFLSGAELVFHCAAELQNPSIMWDVNVNGTQNVLKLCGKENIKYFCYLSSAGVVGKTQGELVTESNICNPQNPYEESKWAAEQLVQKGIEGASMAILRPTNVIDGCHPGALKLGMNHGLKNKLKVLIQGAECAHLVHAEDVARAAVHFIGSRFRKPKCFFISQDDDPENTVAGVSATVHSVLRKIPLSFVKKPLHFPLYIPYFIRRVTKGKSNFGNVKYSSEKLVKHGFIYKYGVKEMTEDMVQNNE